MKSTRGTIVERAPSHPARLERTLALAADDRALAGLDANSLIDLLVQLEHVERALQAARYRALAALAQHPEYGSRPVQKAAAEVARKLRISERSAQTQITEALTLTRVFPEALEELAAGRMQVTQVRALIEATSALDDTAARAVQERVLSRLSGQNPAQTRTAFPRAVIKTDPEATREALSRTVVRVGPGGAQRRHEIAREDRRVANYPEKDGMGTVGPDTLLG